MIRHGTNVKKNHVLVCIWIPIFLIQKCIKFLCISTKTKAKRKCLRLKFAAYWLFCHAFELGILKQLQKQPKNQKHKLDLNGNKQSFYDKRANMKYWLSFKFDLKALVTPFPLNFKFHNIVFNQMVHDIILKVGFKIRCTLSSFQYLNQKRVMKL